MASEMKMQVARAVREVPEGCAAGAGEGAAASVGAAASAGVAAGAEMGAQADAGAVLSIRDVSFAYPKRPGVLRGVSLDVREGECLCLMGVNGCGKSTLIDCILREHKSWSGGIFLGGRDVRELKAAQMARLVSFVPQVHERSFPYTVEHVVLMGRTAWMDGAPDQDDRACAREALATCGMGRFADRPYTELSGGEMQMVLLARALAQDAPLIVMDEPTAHLDFKNELLFLETVEELLSSGRATVLMATHAPNQAFQLAESGVLVRVGVMSEGRMVTCGAPEDTLTPSLLREVFGVRARRAVAPAEAGLPAISRIVPVASIR